MAKAKSLKKSFENTNTPVVIPDGYATGNLSQQQKDDVVIAWDKNGNCGIVTQYGTVYHGP